MTDRVTVEEPPGIEATGVVKAFGTVTALDGVDLTVSAGTLAALLGPNGAGKTTLVRIIATLSRPDAGRVRVFGHDVTRQPGQVRSRTGLTGQYAGLDEELRGLDNLVLIGRLAGLRRREACQRAGELADALGLAHAAGRAVRTYSGGMRRRLDLAASLMTRPSLLILDEPTTGLDPASRQQLWATLGELRAQGTTMLLTTQYLEEADRFADVVHVLNRGRIIASGTATQLKALVGGRVAEIRLADPTAVPGAARDLAKRLALAPDDIRADAGGGLLTVAAPDGTATLLAAAAALASAGIVADDLGLRQPSLDEAFLALTGDGDVTGAST